MPPSHVRFNACLDASTRAKVDDLAKRFHQPRAAVLTYIMHWGLSRGPMEAINQGESPGPVRHFYLSVASDLYAHVQQVATTAGVKVAPWLRHMVRQITMTDFPASWQKARSEERSHDSRVYHKRFMSRLDDLTWEKLEEWSTYFDTSAAEIIRQLVAHATIEDFPSSWHMRAGERWARPAQRETMGRDQALKP